MSDKQGVQFCKSIISVKWGFYMFTIMLIKSTSTNIDNCSLLRPADTADFMSLF